MKKMKRIYWIPLLLAALLAGCGGGSVSGQSGTAQLSLTDAPSTGESFDNVLITVKEVWFHKSDAAGPGEAGWLKYPLPLPKTVDLARLTDGVVSQILDQTLPVGNYQQIRILLADTNDNNYLFPYNNEVIVGGLTFPLRIPAPAHGIALVGRFQVTDGGTLRLAIDFDIGHDVVKVTRDGQTEYILKPRLRYFDLGNVGSIRGQIDPATRAAGHFFVFKAEQKSDDGSRYVVKRFTGIRADNTFLLSFLPPGTYDVLLRGRDVETVIVRGVPVTKGAITDISTQAINMPAGTEFTANTTTNPTGAWVNFYQTLDNAMTGVPEAPYEIRFRHIDPFTGSFFVPIALSNGTIHFGTYNNGDAISFQAIAPVEWVGGNAGFTAVADASLFQPTSFVPFDNTSAGPVFVGRMNVMAGATPYTASGTISSFMGRSMRLDNNILFMVHNGLIVDAYRNLNVPMQMGPGMTAAYAAQPLPGGFPGAFYGIDGLGWSASPPTFAVGIPGLADLRTGDDTSANFVMLKIF
ncbi:MAG: DUF4382 domain-containing protein [Deltaproteobacteria bacterium]|nr:DUF4382 domain-containing protein [Deltaproteobacteria bacterium]